MTTTTNTTLARPRLVGDTVTMSRRNLLHNVRNPTGPILAIVGGAVILMLFVYVFGGTLGAGLIPGGTRSDYLAYIAPAIVLMGAVGIMQMIAVWISMDMSEGIVSRFRTMAIAPSSVLAGHACSGVVLVIVSTVPLLGFAMLLGYRPHADGLQWLALARAPPADRRRAVVARRRVRARLPPGGERQQPAPDRAHPADGEQRLRPGRLLPRLAPGVRPLPTVHPDHQHHPRTPRRQPGRQRRGLGDRLARLDRGRRVRVVHVAVPAPHHRSLSRHEVVSGVLRACVRRSGEDRGAG